MAWLNSLFQQAEPLNKKEALRQELLRLGIKIDAPELALSTSSTSSSSSLSLSSDSSCEESTLMLQHQKTLNGEPNKSMTFLELLKGVNQAVDRQQMIFQDNNSPGALVDMVLLCPVQAKGSRPRRRRSICPQFVAAHECSLSHSLTLTVKDKEVEGAASVLSWRCEGMQTFPKTSLRRSKSNESDGSLASSIRSNEDRSVSFSPEVHVLEFERDMVQYSSPEWSGYYS
jgi:hypothetical protein